MYRLLMLLFGKRFIHDLARMVAEEVIRAYELGQEKEQTAWIELHAVDLDPDDNEVGGTDA